MVINYSENGDTVKIRVRKDHKIEINEKKTKEDN